MDTLCARKKEKKNKNKIINNNKHAQVKLEILFANNIPFLEKYQNFKYWTFLKFIFKFLFHFKQKIKQFLIFKNFK